MIILNDEKIEFFTFPGGERHCKIQNPIYGLNSYVTAILKSSNDIIDLLLFCDSIKRLMYKSIHLTIPYFPYARQDRVFSHGEPFGLKVMANIINTIVCESIAILDPHSDVTPALINNCYVIKQHLCLNELIIRRKLSEEGKVLICPDAGAYKKSAELIPAFKDCIPCTKKRTRTGEIVSTQVHGEVKGQMCMIVDDICDGGSTFLNVAKILKEKGAKSIELYVTHGIFSNGAIGKLRKYIDHIYCYYTFLNKSEIEKFRDILTVYKPEWSE